MVRSLEERGLKVRQGEEVSGRLREDALARTPLKSFQAPEKSETKKERVTHCSMASILRRHTYADFGHLPGDPKIDLALLGGES